MIVLLGADHGSKAALALARALSQRLAQRGIAAKLRVDPCSERVPDASALEVYRQDKALILLLTSASPTPVDDALRSALIDAKLGFAAVHGEGEERLANAWRAIGAEAQPAGGRRAFLPGAAAASWSCDKCSDPECEHRLFTDLLAQRR
ncbi:hypothetical protein [Variovorax defluvii]|uniref:hypothetical protein n=1 Tax=Variovorax defluvii TaxID=913761 RepID=UPI0031EB69D1